MGIKTKAKVVKKKTVSITAMLADQDRRLIARSGGLLKIGKNGQIVKATRRRAGG